MESVDLIIHIPEPISSHFCTAQTLIGNWPAKIPRSQGASSPAPKLGLPASQEKPLARPFWSCLYSASALKDLQIEYIDLDYQHRVDPKVPIEIVLEALRPAVESGTVHWLGLSNRCIDTLRRVKAIKGLGKKSSLFRWNLAHLRSMLKRVGRRTL